MKKILIILLTLVLIFAFSACSSDEPDLDQAGDGQTEGLDNGADGDGSRIENIVSQFGDTYYIKMNMQEDIDGDGQMDDVEVLSAVKGDMTSSDMICGDQRTVTIYVDNSAYLVLPNEKVYMEYLMQPEEMNDIIGLGGNIDYASAVKGTEEIDGVSYEYEEINVDGILERYYFDGDKWVGIRSQESYIQIADYGTDVKDVWFEVPADCVRVDGDAADFGLM